MSDDALYHDRLMALARAADGAGRLEKSTGRATLDNPLCGDRATVEVIVDGGTVVAVAHDIKGCILCQAAAAAVGRHAPGADPAGLLAVVEAVPAMLAADPAPPPPWPDLDCFRPVRAVKSRHRCVTLPFEALGEALRQALQKTGGNF